MKRLELLDGSSNEIIDTMYDEKTGNLVITFGKGGHECEELSEIFNDKSKLGVMKVYESDILMSYISKFTNLVEVKILAGSCDIEVILAKEVDGNEERMSVLESTLAETQNILAETQSKLVETQTSLDEAIISLTMALASTPETPTV